MKKARKLEPGEGAIELEEKGTEEAKIRRAKRLIDIDVSWARVLKPSFWHEVALLDDVSASRTYEFIARSREQLEVLFQDTLSPLFQRAEDEGTSVHAAKVSAAWSQFVNKQNSTFADALDRALTDFSTALLAKDPSGNPRMPEMERQVKLWVDDPESESQKREAILGVWTRFVHAHHEKNLKLARSVIDPVKGAIDALMREFHAIQTMRCDLSWAKLCLSVALELFEFDLPATGKTRELKEGGIAEIVAECRAKASLLRALRTAKSPANKFFLKYCWWPSGRDKIAIVLGKAMILDGYARAEGTTDIAAGHAFVVELAKGTTIPKFQALAHFEALAGIRVIALAAAPPASPSEAEVGTLPVAKQAISSEELERAIAEVIAEMIEEQESVPKPTPVASDIDVY